MTDNPAHFHDAAKTVAGQLSSDSLEKMRAVAFAGAGVCIAIALTILQMSGPHHKLLLSLCFASFGIPLFAAAAFMVENYISHGDQSRKNLRSPAAFWLMLIVFLIGGACLIASLTLVLHHYSHFLAWGFLSLSALSVVLVMWHNAVTKPGA